MQPPRLPRILPLRCAGAGGMTKSALAIRPITIGALADMLRDTLQLETVAMPDADDATALGRELSSPEVSSPGLVLAEYTEQFGGGRAATGVGRD